jgi:lipopolysaccharide export system protein LptA
MTHSAPLIARIASTAVVIVAALTFVASHSAAQSEKKLPTLFKASPQKKDEPIKITADKLEVRDKSKIATFSGDVHVIQGDTNLRCKELVVFYDQDLASGSKKTADVGKGDAGKSGSQQIRRMEAKGSNVLRGQRMVVNLTTNIVQVDSSGGRVEGIFDSKSAKPGK